MTCAASSIPGSFREGQRNTETNRVCACTPQTEHAPSKSIRRARSRSCEATLFPVLARSMPSVFLPPEHDATLSSKVSVAACAFAINEGWTPRSSQIVMKRSILCLPGTSWATSVPSIERATRESFHASPRLRPRSRASSLVLVGSTPVAPNSSRTDDRKTWNEAITSRIEAVSATGIVDRCFGT